MKNILKLLNVCFAVMFLSVIFSTVGIFACNSKGETFWYDDLENVSVLIYDERASDTNSYEFSGMETRNVSFTYHYEEMDNNSESYNSEFIPNVSFKYNGEDKEINLKVRNKQKLLFREGTKEISSVKENGEYLVILVAECARDKNDKQKEEVFLGSITVGITVTNKSTKWIYDTDNITFKWEHPQLANCTDEFAYNDFNKNNNLKLLYDNSYQKEYTPKLYVYYKGEEKECYVIINKESRNENISSITERGRYRVSYKLYPNITEHNNKNRFLEIPDADIEVGE